MNCPLSRLRYEFVHLSGKINRVSLSCHSVKKNIHKIMLIQFHLRWVVP